MFVEFTESKPDNSVETERFCIAKENERALRYVKQKFLFFYTLSARAYNRICDMSACHKQANPPQTVDHVFGPPFRSHFSKKQLPLQGQACTKR